MIQESKSNKEQKKPHIEEYIGKLQDLYQIEKTSQRGAEEQLKGLIEGSISRDIIIPEGVTSISSFAFCYLNKYNTTSGKSGPITSVTIPNSVVSIGNSAFEGCTGLTSVTIPESVTEIGTGAFYNCSGLTSVTIGNSVTSIGGYAFADCIALTSLTIPKSVRLIESGALLNCLGLHSITCLSTIPPLASNLGPMLVNADDYIYVPAESVEAYKAAPGWINYADKIQAIPA